MREFGPLFSGCEIDVSDQRPSHRGAAAPPTPLARPLLLCPSRLLLLLLLLRSWPSPVALGDSRGASKPTGRCVCARLCGTRWTARSGRSTQRRPSRSCPKTRCPALPQNKTNQNNNNTTTQQQQQQHTTTKHNKTNKQTSRQAVKQTSRQADKQTSRQTDRQTDKQTAAAAAAKQGAGCPSPTPDPALGSCPLSPLSPRWAAHRSARLCPALLCPQDRKIDYIELFNKDSLKVNHPPPPNPLLCTDLLDRPCTLCAMPQLAELQRTVALQRSCAASQSAALAPPLPAAGQAGCAGRAVRRHLQALLPLPVHPPRSVPARPPPLPT